MIETPRLYKVSFSVTAAVDLDFIDLARNRTSDASLYYGWEISELKPFERKKISQCNSLFDEIYIMLATKHDGLELCQRPVWGDC